MHIDRRNDPSEHHLSLHISSNDLRHSFFPLYDHCMDIARPEYTIFPTKNASTIHHRKLHIFCRHDRHRCFAIWSVSIIAHGIFCGHPFYHRIRIISRHDPQIIDPPATRHTFSPHTFSMKKAWHVFVHDHDAHACAPDH